MNLTNLNMSIAYISVQLKNGCKRYTLTVYFIISSCSLTPVFIQWSYGVTMWEIFTCGRVPYAGIHAMGLLKGLKRGERLEKSENKACHDDMFVLND